MSPSEIFIPSTFPKIFLIKISFLSAKKLKFVLVRFKPPNSSEFKFFDITSGYKIIKCALFI